MREMNDGPLNSLRHDRCVITNGGELALRLKQHHAVTKSATLHQAITVPKQTARQDRRLLDLAIGAKLCPKGAKCDIEARVLRRRDACEFDIRPVAFKTFRVPGCEVGWNHPILQHEIKTRSTLTRPLSLGQYGSQNNRYASLVQPQVARQIALSASAAGASLESCSSNFRDGAKCDFVPTHFKLRHGTPGFTINKRDEERELLGDAGVH